MLGSLQTLDGAVQRVIRQRLRIQAPAVSIEAIPWSFSTEAFACSVTTA
ncbi:MAG: hypothetical protein NZ954_06905 [Thermofilaceae archaeon]|nr:hypothetical protein [Thermofilaceae archaeon]MCX8179764.1 hypothetical protein [Thermofilaceae archaeon]MDW8004291.1 hypothetical protein [Thermofilaceae archaeon]